MEWRGRRESDNVEDQRGRRISGGGIAGLGGAGIVIVLLIAVLTGQNPMTLLQSLGTQVDQSAPGAATDQPYQETPAEHELVQFVRVVLADTEDTWGEIFTKQLGRAYERPTLVLFTDAVRSGCGTAEQRAHWIEQGFSTGDLTRCDTFKPGSP